MNKILFFFALIFFSLESMGQWSQISVFPATATDGAFSFVIDGRGYTGGGLAENSMYSYDPGSDKWSKKASVPTQGGHLAWAFGFEINGKGYVGGGSYEFASDLTDKVYEYDPVMDQWTEKASFPGGQMDGFFSFSIGEKGYVGGGFDGSYLLADFYEYDPKTDQWKQLPDFPGGPVIFGGSFVIGNKAYVGTGGQGSTQISTLWEFDPSVQKWTKKADFPGQPRQAVFSFAIGNRGYMGGGMANYNTSFTDFYEYNPYTDKWQKLPNEFPTDQTAWGTAFVIENYVYAGTGTDMPDFNFSKAFYRHKFDNASGFEINSQDLKMRFFPNPATDKIFLNTSEGKYYYHIFSISGKVVLEGKLENREIKIGNLPDGTYLLRINGDNEARVFKFFKAEGKQTY